MPQLTDDDYYTLDHFVQAVLTRVRDGTCSISEGRSDLMHPLTAWDKGNSTEFGPRMNLMMNKWKNGNA